MCLSPISVVNPTKFISLDYSQKYLLSVPCGKCSECQTKLSNEWYFRAYHEFSNCVKNGYVLFDTLTYDNENLPHVSDFYNVPDSLDYSCFNRDDVRKFLVRLRRNLSYYGYNISNKLRYFLTSEYGSDDRYTHRPHYHILFYVYENCVPPLVLSRAVSDSWQKGRTDGVPFKSSLYVMENRVYKDGLSQTLSVCKYVSKYVQKDSSFQSEIDKRINYILYNDYLNSRGERYFMNPFKLAGSDFNVYSVLDSSPDDISFSQYLKSESGRKLKLSINHTINQFHLQSLGFGASALNDIDLYDLMETGTLKMPDSSVIKKIPLPLYYYRKLFQELVSVNGQKVWQDNSDGVIYRAKRLKDSVTILSDKLKSIASTLDYPSFDFNSVARYVIYYKGRIRSNYISSPTVENVLNSDFCLYNYVNMSDYRHFNQRFLSLDYLGYCDNYDDSPFEPVPLSYFLSKFVIDSESNSWSFGYDSLLHDLYSKYNDYLSKQQTFDFKQHLKNKYKTI